MLCPICKKEYEEAQMKSLHNMLMVCKNCLCEPMPEITHKCEFNVISAPSHYIQDRSIQPIDVIMDWDMGFLDGQVLKYISRYKSKGGVEDLLKAKFYLEKLITSLSI